MQIFLLTLFLFTFIFFLNALQHQCYHDKLKKVSQYHSIPPDDEFLDVRNLQKKKTRNMVISYDMPKQNLSTNKGSTQEQQKLLFSICEKALKLAIDYFNRLIKIVPKSEQNMRYKSTSYQKCGGIKIPQNDKGKRL
ncbi:leishmanolysin family protein, putative [Ichthyophthirius multifiliis]|uniref:Leishmanolysin family protein, putative n=1 Tax=Ichthyophthirius multifiliis TaxID=5932 RepID=G0QLB5_ICHMU|nr:leishmanolysin family protein, putative [Ichthyophthirius multifiliis]EGR33989.1 leishmanolysin family protein, putative [Ichthyophthirius multifiliis]|eukprot:XP_004039293.1 leishmanolysin family protein, putative [Ichthyophthirius multifiliis]